MHIKCLCQQEYQTVGGVRNMNWERQQNYLIQAAKPRAETHCQVHNELEGTTPQRCQHNHCISQYTNCKVPMAVLKSRNVLTKEHKEDLKKSSLTMMSKYYFYICWYLRENTLGRKIFCTQKVTVMNLEYKQGLMFKVEGRALSTTFSFGNSKLSYSLWYFARKSWKTCLNQA